VTRLPLRMTETGLELAYPVALPELSESPAFLGIGSYSLSGLNVGSENPERLRAAAVTPGFLAALDVRPSIGRVFTDEDMTQGDRVGVISHRVWQRRFGADPMIVGRSIALNGRGFVVIGVMPPTVNFPETADMWIPHSADPQIASQVAVPIVLARLAPGVTALQARAEVLRLTQGRPITRQDARSSTLRVTPLKQALDDQALPILWTIGSGALLVLTVACMNVANLLLTRVTAREREFAVRRAIGASHLLVARQVLIESFLLAIAAGLTAVPIAGWTLDALRAFVPPTFHGAQDIALNGRSLASLAFFSLLAAGLCGLAPSVCVLGRAANVLRGAPATTMDRFWRRFRSLLVVSEIAGAVALLVGAVTLVRTLADLTAVDLGAHDERALVMEVTLPATGYASSDRIRLFYERLRDELRRVPGVSEVGATNHLPGSTTVISPSQVAAVEGRTLPSSQTDNNAVRLSATPGYFAALGIDVLAGRTFTDADRPGTRPVAMVSERFARAFRFEPHEIVGRRVNLGFGEERWVEVIGVVRDVRMRGPESDLQAAIYAPFAQIPINATGYVVAKAGPRPHDLIPAIRMAVAQVDPSLPLYNIRTFDNVRADYLAERRLAMTTMWGSEAWRWDWRGLDCMA
jgi:putative ABC transport system permease protein